MKLFYRELGSGQPIIILHGLFGMSDNWITFAKKFAQTNKVYILDLRNHGQSPHHPQFTYDLLVDDLLEFIKDKKLQNIILLGHSMGGKLAMKFSLEYPAYINKMIIVDITARAYNIARFKSILETMQSLPLKDMTSRKEADTILTKTIPLPGLRKFLLKNLTFDRQNHFKWKLNIDSLLNNLDNISTLIESEDTRGKSFNKNVLLIRGALSDYVTQEDIHGLKCLFPALQIEIISDSTHWVHAESPDAFYKAVKDFLQN